MIGIFDRVRLIGSGKEGKVLDIVKVYGRSGEERYLVELDRRPEDATLHDIIADCLEEELEKIE